MNNYFLHCVAVENLYEKVVTSVSERYGLTYMELTILLFLANYPQYDTATEIIKVRKLSKSHASLSIRSLQEQGLLEGEHQGGDHRTIHLHTTAAAAKIIEDGRAAQTRFYEIAFAGFSENDMAMIRQGMQRINQNIEDFTEKSNMK